MANHIALLKKTHLVQQVSFLFSVRKNSFRALIFSVIMGFTSCGSGYLPGFDFASFHGTPVVDLADAVEDDDPARIAEFLRQNPELVDYQESKFGFSLLFLAVVNDKRNAARSLLDHGANISLKSNNEDSSDVMMVLCKHYGSNDCDTGMLRLLLQYSPDLTSYCYNNPRDKTSLLTNACYSTQVCLEFIKVLVDSGADIDYAPDGDPAGSPISMAIMLDRLDIARYFIIERKATIPAYCIMRPERDTYVPITVKEILMEQTYEAQLPSERATLVKLRDELVAYIDSLEE